MLEESFCEASDDLAPVVRLVAMPDLPPPASGNAASPYNVGADQRRFVRRAINRRAHLTLLNTLHPNSDRKVVYEVPVSNISRNGACIFHHEQLFPGDQLILDFGTLCRKFQVTRCRRKGDRCFETGVQVLA